DDAGRGDVEAAGRALDAGGLQPEDLGRLDLDRVEAHHEGEPAGREHRGEGGDEGLHVEVLHEHADCEPEGRAEQQHDGHDDAGWHPVAQEARPEHAGEGHDRADREVDAAREDHEGHADREDEKVGVVEQQRRDDARREEVAEIGLPRDEDEDEQGESREHRDPRRATADEPLEGAERIRLLERCLNAGHRATSEVLGRAPCAVRVTRERSRGDWMSTTITTATARNSGATAEGTPRKRIVERSVSIVKTPMTVPATVNSPPMSEVPPSTTARIAYSSM